MTDGHGEHRPPPPLQFPAPPPGSPAGGPRRVVTPPSPTPTIPGATAPRIGARPAPPAPARHQLLVTLVDSDPLIWRRLVVPSDTTLAKVHRILQAALGWTESHLHQFVIGETVYGDPDLLTDDPPQASTRKTRLGQVAPDVGATLRYAYDFGDGWDHLIIVERLLWHDASTKGATCLAGGGACPPEDCGGIGGYADLLATLRRGRGEEYRDMLAWLGGPFDPDAFDLASTNRALRRLR